MEQSCGGEAHLLNRSGADHFGVALAEVKDRKEHLLQLLSAFLVVIFGSDTKLLAGLIERVAHCHEFLIVFKPYNTSACVRLRCFELKPARDKRDLDVGQSLTSRSPIVCQTLGYIERPAKSAILARDQIGAVRGKFSQCRCE